jgi:hypothetical protein
MIGDKVKKWLLMLMAFAVVVYGFGSSAVILYRSTEIAMELAISANIKYAIVAGVALGLLWMLALILDFVELIYKKGNSISAVPSGEDYGPE